MKLKVLQLDLKWKSDLPLERLRPWLLDQLKEYGEPLRWAIVQIEPSDSAGLRSKLKIEAVVIDANLGD